MNQAIHFPDREIWDENKQAVCFPVLVHGMQLTCAIKGRRCFSALVVPDPLAVFVKIAGIWKRKPAI